MHFVVKNGLITEDQPAANVESFVSAFVQIMVHVLVIPQYGVHFTIPGVVWIGQQLFFVACEALL